MSKLTDDQFDLPARLAQLLDIWASLTPEARAADAGQRVEAEIRGIGQAAAYFGGWEAMKGLDEAAATTGAPTVHLGRMWHGIGVWVD